MTEFLFSFFFMLPLALAVMINFIVTNPSYAASLPLTKRGHDQFYPKWPRDGWGAPCIFFVWVFFLAALAAVGYLWFILLCQDLYAYHKKRRNAKHVTLEKTSPQNPFPQPAPATPEPAASVPPEQRVHIVVRQGTMEETPPQPSPATSPPGSATYALAPAPLSDTTPFTAVAPPRGPVNVPLAPLPALPISPPAASSEPPAPSFPMYRTVAHPDGPPSLHMTDPDEREAPSQPADPGNA